MTASIPYGLSAWGPHGKVSFDLPVSAWKEEEPEGSEPVLSGAGEWDLPRV